MSAVQQVSVFLENKSGRLADVTKVLADGGINVGALSIADTSDFGILRFICSDPNRAARMLRQAGFSVGETEVLAVTVPHRAGGLAELVETIRPLGANIEYLYAFMTKLEGSALVVLRIEGGRDAQVAETLRSAGYHLASAEEAYDF